jgi:hypothetical protein
MGSARVVLNPDYERLALVVTQARNASYNDFYQQFALLALHDGMQLSYFEKACLNKKYHRFAKSNCLH